MCGWSNTADYLWIKEHTASASDKDFLTGVRILQHARGQSADDVGSVAHPERSICACTQEIMNMLLPDGERESLRQSGA